MSTLTEAHRLAQLRIGTRTVALMRKAWGLLDPADLDQSFADWLPVVVTIVQSQRRTSAALAANYLTTFRALELGEDPSFVPVLADRAVPQAVATSMLVTGPVSIRAALRRGDLEARAVDVAQARTAGAAMRHVLDGGRETITRSVTTDRRARGYQRVTSGKACDFCTLLAGRGGVYGEASADFPAHDHCSCSAEPVYR